MDPGRRTAVAFGVDGAQWKPQTTCGDEHVRDERKKKSSSTSYTAVKIPRVTSLLPCGRRRRAVVVEREHACLIINNKNNKYVSELSELLFE